MSPYSDSPVEFIKLLKSQHRSIVATVYEIDSQAGGPENLKSSIERLNRITDLLFDHLEKEDKELYPVLLSSNETAELAKKYSYDMERLSCIAVDFFKRYCVNREGLKIFVEDFINGYSLFRGLLKVRIKREETELYPAFILLESGVLYSDVLHFVQEKEVNHAKQKNVFVFGQDQSNLEALTLALEILGYRVTSTSRANQVPNLIQSANSDLILLDVTKVNPEIKDLVTHLRGEKQQRVNLVGYSTNETGILEESLQNNLDDFIPKPALDLEALSEKVKSILT